MLQPREGHDDIVADLMMYGSMLASMRPPSAGSGRRCPSVNQQDQNGNTPLHLAAGRGHIDVIRALERTAESTKLDLGILNRNGWTPLQLAALNGHTDAVMELVKLKPKAAFPRTLSDPRAPPRDAETSERALAFLTPLHIASRRGHVKLVRRLLDWMKEHEEDIDDDSSDDEESSRRIFDSAFSQTQKFAARSFRLLKKMASKSKTKLQTLISFQRPMDDVLDRGFEMSRLSTDDDEHQAGDRSASDDTKPLIQRQIGNGPSDLEPELVAFAGDDGAPAAPSRTELVDPAMNSKDYAAKSQSPGVATAPFAAADEETCPQRETLPVKDATGTDASMINTEILPSLDEAAFQEQQQDPRLHEATSLASRTKGKPTKGKSRKPGIPRVAKPRPRVAAHQQGLSSASGHAGITTKPGRAGPTRRSIPGSRQHCSQYGIHNRNQCEGKGPRHFRRTAVVTDTCCCGPYAARPNRQQGTESGTAKKQEAFHSPAPRSAISLKVFASPGTVPHT